MANFTWEDPGIGAFFSGQRRAEERAKTRSNLMSDEINRMHTLEQIYRSQQLLPIELELKRKEAAIKDAVLAEKESEVSEKEQKRRKEATDNFFEYMMKYDDLEGAIEYSGVPRKFAEKFSTLTPEQRQQLYKVWRERAAEPERIKEDIKTRGRLKEIELQRRLMLEQEKLKQEEMTKRALALQELKNNMARELLQLRAEIGQMKNQNYQQRVTMLMERINQLQATQSGDPEVEARKLVEMQRMMEEVNKLVQMDIAARQAGQSIARPGSPDVGQLGVPVHPQQPVPLPYPPTGGGQPVPSPQPQVGNPMMPPPGAVRPR